MSDRRCGLGALGGALACGLLLSAGGCGSTPEPAPSRSASQPLVDRPTGEVPDTVERSQLRELALDTLIDAASDENPGVRANAVEALAMAPTRLESILPVVLADDNLVVRTVACLTVGRSRRCDLVPLVEPLTNDSSAYVRTAALYAMARCGYEVDLSPIAAMLFNSPTTRERAHAAFVLGELNDPTAIPMLRQAASLDVPRASDIELKILQLQIAEALFKLGDSSQLHTVQAALFPSRSEDLEATALAVQIIGEIGARQSINDLTNLAIQSDEAGNPMPAEIRLAVAGSLAKLGRRDGWFVAEELWESENPQLRAQSAYVLGMTRYPEHLPILGELMGDSDPVVRVSAAAATTRIVGQAR